VIEDKLRKRVNDLNGRQTDPDKQRQLESVEYVRHVMSNLTNTDNQTPEVLLDQQQHVLNFNN